VNVFGTKELTKAHNTRLSTKSSILYGETRKTQAKSINSINLIILIHSLQYSKNLIHLK